HEQVGLDVLDLHHLRTGRRGRLVTRYRERQRAHRQQRAQRDASCHLSPPRARPAGLALTRETPVARTRTSPPPPPPPSRPPPAAAPPAHCGPAATRGPRRPPRPPGAGRSRRRS